MLVTATKWTWEYVDDEMTMPRFQQLTNYWKKFPPEHLSLVAVKKALGIKVGETPAASRTGTDDYEPPEFASSKDVTQLIAASPFSDQFGMKRLKVINIDSRKKD